MSEMGTFKKLDDTTVTILKDNFDVTYSQEQASNSGHPQSLSDGSSASPSNEPPQMNLQGAIPLKGATPKKRAMPKKVLQLPSPEYVIYTDTELEQVRKHYFEMKNIGREGGCILSKELRCRLVRNTMTNMVSILRETVEAEDVRSRTISAPSCSRPCLHLPSSAIPVFPASKRKRVTLPRKHSATELPIPPQLLAMDLPVKQATSPLLSSRQSLPTRQSHVSVSDSPASSHHSTSRHPRQDIGSRSPPAKRRTNPRISPGSSASSLGPPRQPRQAHTVSSGNAPCSQPIQSQPSTLADLDAFKTSLLQDMKALLQPVSDSIETLNSRLTALETRPDKTLPLISTASTSSVIEVIDQNPTFTLTSATPADPLYNIESRRITVSPALRKQIIEEIRLTLRGMEKSLPPSSPSRQPISTDLLLHLIIALRQGCFNPFDDIVMETLCLIAFFGFLRCSEFSTPSTSSFPALGLKRSDLSQIPGNHFILHIRSSKTDQLSQDENRSTDQDSKQAQARHYRTLQEVYKRLKPNKDAVAQLLDLEFEARRAFIDSDTLKDQDRPAKIIEAYPCFKDLNHHSEQDTELEVLDTNDPLWSLVERATRHLGIEWQAMELPRLSLFESPSVRSPQPRTLPAFPDFIKKVQSTWGAPATSPATSQKASAFAMLGASEAGLASFPPVDAAFAALGRKPKLLGLAKDPACPNRQCRTMEVHLKKGYSAASEAVTLANLLSVYQASLVKDLPEHLSVSLRAELALVTQLLVKIAQLNARAQGRSIASLVVARRQLWLSQVRVQDPDKTPLLDAPITTGHTFGPAVEEMLQHSAKAREAFQQMAKMWPHKPFQPKHQQEHQWRRTPQQHQLRPWGAKTSPSSTAARGQHLQDRSTEGGALEEVAGHALVALARPLTNTHSRNSPEISRQLLTNPYTDEADKQNTNKQANVATSRDVKMRNRSAKEKREEAETKDIVQELKTEMEEM
ncbi:UNVERIFIED_CONTAM: hypothetical protein FKN15_019561 [Acipenser sinensis]